MSEWKSNPSADVGGRRDVRHVCMHIHIYICQRVNWGIACENSVAQLIEPLLTI